MLPRIIFIHGNGTSHWSFGFSTWLKPELEKAGFPTFFETFPDSIQARAEYWLAFLHDHVKAGESDVIVGWSSGAVAAMRYAQENRVLGSVLIGPSYTDLGDDMEKQSGYFNAPWNWEKIKKNQRHIALIYGDDDPYIAQSEFEFIAANLHSDVIKVAGGKHFLEYSKFPQLLAYIIKTYK